MKNKLDYLNSFFFGKYLKLFLMLGGILFCLSTVNPYRNTDSETMSINIRNGVIGIGLIFTSVYIHVNELNSK